IIHSYFNELKGKTSIYISLAHFYSLAGNTITTPHDDKAINSQIDNILEMKIVNQLVNQIEPGKIPKANFLTKKNIKNRKIIFYSLSIICLILYFKFLLPVITEKITYSIKNFPPNLEFIDYILIIISIITMI
ncbi:YobI family P-loop NTPase, partial [Streptococcus suis]